jgi:hypothetical protein
VSVLVAAIRARLRAIADERRELCVRTSQLDDEREQLLAELERLDRRAYREEAL